MTRKRAGMVGDVIVNQEAADPDKRFAPVRRLVKQHGREEVLKRIEPEPVAETILIPRLLHNKLMPVLAARNLTLEEVCRLYLRSLVTTAEKSRPLELDDLMPFGKYKGETMSTVIRAEPSYIAYLINDGAKLSLSPKALVLYEEVTGLRSECPVEKDIRQM